MCGLVGVIAKNKAGNNSMLYVDKAIGALQSRGPDGTNYYSDDEVSLGHCRLSIIDLSENGDQPMSDPSKRYQIIYNGEIFNYRKLREELEAEGVIFNSHSDTEVLLQLYMRKGREMLPLLNGFFAFAIYDRAEKSCFIARDRFGVKPLYYYENEDCLVFASEMRAILQFPFVKKLDEVSLYEYLQLNYIPAPATILTSVKKLLPGYSIYFRNNTSKLHCYYKLPEKGSSSPSRRDYISKQKELAKLLADAVQMRLISDVPLGAFLSGGIDSSIICGLAAQHTDKLRTFSIGYKDDLFFDETKYARLVAKHFKTDHTVFTLSRNDLYESLFDVLNYFSEPFGDSSALPLYILSKLASRHVKVVLSGDGADELFGGYIKHMAEYRARNAGLGEMFVSSFGPLLRYLPQSRNNPIENISRQLQRFAEGMKKNESERYWRWCSIAAESEADQLMSNFSPEEKDKYYKRKKNLTSHIHKGGDLNDVFRNDVSLVLSNDMLHKVDLMSMAHGLEVRTPFLDYRVVEFVFSIPAEYKISRNQKKIILRDAFRDFLPKELYTRPKKGFEIPLHSFLTNECRGIINELLSEDFIISQQLFNPSAVLELKKQLFSGNPADSPARVWGLIVFQHWWKNTME
jgi:asparagine synthase (glutamine-hydrolysing)